MVADSWQIEKSHLFKLITKSKDDKEVMPEKGKVLSKAQITKIRTWIKEGATLPANLSLVDKSKKKK